MTVRKRPTNKTEGGETFRRLTNTVPLYYMVYDNQLNMVTESKRDKPLPAGNVVDSLHESFGALTHAEMVTEANRLKIKR